jgi:N-acetylmuramoyl-L-alanine amidase
MKRALLLLLVLTSCTQQGAPPATVGVPRSEIPHGHPKKRIPGVLICIDPGHGGKDPGTQSTKHDTQEKRLALATALLVQNHLRVLGYETCMTRDKDVFISLNDRADLANKRKATHFVSIHYNAAPSKEAMGLEVFSFRSKGDRETESKKLASSVLDKMLHYTSAPSRGVKEANFAVLRRTEMPAILVEGGFLSNDDELKKLRDPKYGNALAWGIAQGIHSHLEKSK